MKISTTKSEIFNPIPLRLGGRVWRALEYGIPEWLQIPPSASLIPWREVCAYAHTMEQPYVEKDSVFPRGGPVLSLPKERSYEVQTTFWGV
ncbi:MAG: hypothetical protein ACK41Q_10575 [Candidatus Brocadia sp.]